LLNLHARSDALLSAGTSAMKIKVKIFCPSLFYHLVYRSSFLRKPLEQTMDSAFTDGKAKSIVQGLFHPGKRQLLARVKVSDKRFHFFPKL